MRLMLILTWLIILFSCKENRSHNKTNSTGKEADSLTSNPVDETLSARTQRDSLSTIFDEDKRSLSLVYINPAGSADTIVLGNYYNTFGQPPHQVDYKTISENRVAVVVETNIIQLGISSDAVHVFLFDKANMTVKKACTFEEVATYGEGTPLDTLTGVVLYDYQIKPSPDSSAQFILSEYVPYKFEELSRNKTHTYKTKQRMCSIR